MGYSLWKEEPECLEWLKNRAPNSVVYVNFGSIAVLTPTQLVEFGWGLANSKFPFFWVIRPDLFVGDTAILPPEFVRRDQRPRLVSTLVSPRASAEPSISWRVSTLRVEFDNRELDIWRADAVLAVLRGPADQQTDCYFCCKEWGVGMEISNDVKRDEVEKLVRELMEGEKGKEMRKKALGWTELAHDATKPNGSSSVNLDNLVNQVLLRKM